MTTPIQFSDLTKDQCAALYKAAFYESPEGTLDTQKDEPGMLRLTTEKHELFIHEYRFFGHADHPRLKDEWANWEINGTAVRDLLAQYGIPGYTEPEFIQWLNTQRNYDQSALDDFFGTFQLGAYHFATVCRKTSQEPYLYIIHGESHKPMQEFCRTTDFKKFMENLDAVNAMTLEAQKQEFDRR